LEEPPKRGSVGYSVADSICLGRGFQDSSQRQVLEHEGDIPLAVSDFREGARGHALISASREQLEQELGPGCCTERAPKPQ
jgi:hypothetical protein